MSEHVEIEVNGKKVEVRKGKTLLAGLVRSGVRQLHVCGGRGLCSTCRVVVVEGMPNLSPMETRERVSLRGHLSFSGSVRLACQAKVEGPARVRSILPQWGTLREPK